MTYKGPQGPTEDQNHEDQASEEVQEQKTPPAKAGKTRSRPFRVVPPRTGITIPMAGPEEASGASGSTDPGSAPAENAQSPQPAWVYAPQAAQPEQLLRVPGWYDAQALLETDWEAFFAPPGG